MPICTMITSIFYERRWSFAEGLFRLMFIFMPLGSPNRHDSAIIYCILFDKSFPRIKILPQSSRRNETKTQIKTEAMKPKVRLTTNSL